MFYIIQSIFKCTFFTETRVCSIPFGTARSTVNTRFSKLKLSSQHSKKQSSDPFFPILQKSVRGTGTHSLNNLEMNYFNEIQNFRSERKKCMYAVEDTVDDFRTYVQALLSQAVDAGFLQAVINEQSLFIIPYAVYGHPQQ